MSCNILLDPHENSHGNHHNNNLGNNNTGNQYLKRYNSNTFNLLSYAGRLLFIRRLRLFKFYMATICIILLLFFLFKPHNTINENDNIQIKSVISNRLNSPPNQQDTLPTNVANLPDEHVSPASDQYSSLVSPVVYTNNLTILLTMRDFNQMKNINVMQVRIREAMKHSWDSYRRYAWGHDMLKPRSKEPDHWFDLGLTIVDSADTLIMMGLVNDANLALDWMENELKFVTKNENSNCFELTIRILAGLLSAYHLTARDRLKQQAIEFGKVLLHCYDTESKVVPYSDINLNNHHAHPPPWNPHSSLSEVSSLQIEFRYLSQISNNPIYEQTTFQTSVHLHNLTGQREGKLLPMYISPTSGQLEDSIITLGARSDSYYEYLLKQYLQTGIKWLEDDYLDCVDEMNRKLILSTGGIENYTYVAEMHVYKTLNNTEDIKYIHKMDHLVCFLPGTLALGYYHFSPLASEYRLKFNLETPTNKLNSRYNDHLRLAEALSRTCYHMYSTMGTGLAPEIATFVHSSFKSLETKQEDVEGYQVNEPSDATHPAPAELQVQSVSAHNILRPEFVESLFYLYQITGLQMYREQAGQVFEAFQKYSRISSGYSPISDVRQKPPANADLHELLHKYAPDRMESFWLSETLKYLYLTFCDDRHIVGTLLNNYVFNTEAHIVPIPEP